MTAAVVSIRCDWSERRWDLSDGDEITFGSDQEQADLVIPDASLAAVVGQIGATETGWWIENMTADLQVLVEHSNGHDFVVVQGAMTIPSPVASARVLLIGHAGIVSFSVTSTTDRTGGSAHEPAASGRAGLLSESAKYFRVLVALCEPALRSRSVTTVPTSAEIVERLRRVPAYRSMTSTAVNFHLNYLCTQKLRAHVRRYSQIMGIPPQTVARQRRLVLVQLSLHFNLVSHAHQRLLDG
jgi:hypothetical protein